MYAICVESYVTCVRPDPDARLVKTRPTMLAVMLPLTIAMFAHQPR